MQQVQTHEQIPITLAQRETLVSVRGLVKHFPVEGSDEVVRAVDGVSFDIFAGETLGLVGESGCGKSTVGRCLLRLIEPTAGQITCAGQDVLALDKKRLRQLRREMQIIFQDPYASLNPRMKVGDIVAEPLVIHKQGGPRASDRRDEAANLLKRVGLDPDYMNRYPHEFSGGQRQRIGVARALALSPKLIVADEPVSALDVSVQAQVVNLLQELQEEFKLTYVFISHDLSVIRQIADRIAVMYLGHLVELGDSESIYEQPKHPYTAALLSAVPRATTGGRQRIVLTGDVPSPIAPPPACVFHPRCPRFHRGHCDVEEPLLRELAPAHSAACHYPLEKWPMTDDEIRQAEGATRDDRPRLEGAAHD